MSEQEELFPEMGDKQQALEVKQAASQDARPAVPEPEKSTLDEPQTFAEATSYQVRDEFQELVGRDLLGPWDGQEEEFAPRAMGPRERYLVGMIGPKRSATSSRDEADAVPDTETGVQGDAAEADLPDVATAQNLGSIWASSMGLSFAVPADVDVIAVTASWGRYGKSEIEKDDGKKVRTWSRKPVSHDKEIRLDGESNFWVPLTVPRREDPGVHLAVAVRAANGHRVVELSLINTQPEPESNKDAAWLFQTELRVRALDGDRCVFLPIDDPLDGGGAVYDEEDAHLRLLYRHERRYASGRNVAVHAVLRENERCAYELTTTWLPVYDVAATTAPPTIGVMLDMDTLATADLADLRAGLTPLADGYSAWLDKRAADIPALPEALRTAAENAVFKARRAAVRLRLGIELLTDPDALRAFRFANEAMALQRRHSALAKLRQEEGLSYPQAEDRVKGPEHASWRPFQLAFVLLNLPALSDPAHPERAAAPTATADLLFFPTGGGKTEAYLGLTAYTFAIRRLQKVVGTAGQARSGLDGVAVLMRYTLRLLTAQQFQRAAALVCAAEIIRRGDERTWGTTPFRIGLWVGGTVSPNWFEQAAKDISDARSAPESKRTNVLQTLSCPWCGQALKGHQDLRVDDDRRRVLLHCSNGEGQHACPFSRRLSPDEGLPILTVDEEIYRLTPALVIATVDKFAQLPWRGYAGHLFGRVSEQCPRHGYRHEDLNAKTGCSARHNAKGSILPATQSRPVTRLRPPDLIIQDELHLISGALGTTVGLFEAAVDELCTWGEGYGPKIVASTATTKRADAQVLGVFARELAIFPPQVLDVADTYFSRQVPVTPKTPGRRYFGVCAHGVRLKSAEIRLAEILLIAGQTLFDRYGKPADPYQTLVGYFNATRELAGMRRYVDDDVTTRIRTHGKRKGLSNRLATRVEMLTVQELTSRISSTDISQVLRNLEVGFDPEFETSERKLALRMELAMARRDKRREHPLAARWNARSLPVDVVLATSMLQVGVDVSRFGLMVVTGQPKNTAEYIQASSRVGRDAERPGLVVTLYNWSRPRDLAHFEDFEHYHATFYRQVEALSVTPYTRRALDRGVAAAYVAALRNAEETYSRDTDAQEVPLDGPVAARIRDRFLARAESVAGERGRDYLRERLDVVTDRWKEKRTGQLRLGYKTRTSSKQPLAGLLVQAGEGRWETMTVGQSMRETESEINLLVPSLDEMFAPAYGAPPWSFKAVTEGDEDAPEGDELGETR